MATILPDDITVVFGDFPSGKVHEFVKQRPDGTYLIKIDARLNYEMRLKKYQHALKHIEDGDFDKIDIQQIEAEAHEKPIEPPVKAAKIIRPKPRKRRKSKWEKYAEWREEWCFDHHIDPIEDALARRDMRDMMFPR